MSTLLADATAGMERANHTVVRIGERLRPWAGGGSDGGRTIGRPTGSLGVLGSDPRNSLTRSDTGSLS
jgi:hypothetical protein